MEKISFFDSRVLSPVYDSATRSWSCSGFDITKETKDNCLYGGYYENYSWKSAGYNSEDLTYTPNPDGKLWSKDPGTDAKPYTGNSTVWKGAEAYTTSGMKMKPLADTTYYLKEVPDSYLRMTHFETCNYYNVHHNSYLAELYMLTAVDDKNYKEVGFRDYKDATKGLVAKNYDQVTISYPGAANPDAVDNRSVIDLKNISGMSSDKTAPTNGFISMAKKDFTTDDAFSMRPYFITPDNIKVSGIRLKDFTIKDSDNDGNIQSTAINNFDSSIVPEISYKLYRMVREFIESN